jgi:site-specific DNA-methyltransferase (cytosine-N4-specific)
MFPGMGKERTLLTPVGLPASALEAIDWNFGDVKPDAIHNVHPYPAKFIPEIPRLLLQNLRPSPVYAVFDPFCGSGTTLVEAQRLGFSTVGVDLNPIACLLTKVKTMPLPPAFLKTAYDCAHEASGIENLTIPEIPNLTHWFCEEASIGLAKLTQVIRRVTDEGVRDHLRLALSSIIVRVSNQDSDTRYAAVLKTVAESDVYAYFKKASRKLAEAKLVMSPNPQPARVLNKDVLSVWPSDIGTSVGMVITSPPYPNAYEYWLYHKYRMWWLGWDPIGVREAEIGARPHYFRKNPATVEDFRLQMVQVVALVEKVLVKGGYFCIVVGRSKIHGKEVDNSSMFILAAQNAGMRLLTTLARTISPSRKSFNLSHARIKTEDILVFLKP